MFASFNFRCSALPMKIKPLRKFNAYCTISEEAARSRIQRLESYNVHHATAVIILLRTCQLFDALIMWRWKMFEFLNFVAEGYQQKLNRQKFLDLRYVPVNITCCVFFSFAGSPSLQCSNLEKWRLTAMAKLTENRWALAWEYCFHLPTFKNGLYA